MATVTLDTHRIVKRLKDAGFTDTRAETVTDIIAETRATDLADVETKTDIANFGRQSRCCGAGNESLKWLAPLLLGQAGLIAALIKFLP